MVESGDIRGLHILHHCACFPRLDHAPDGRDVSHRESAAPPQDLRAAPVDDETACRFVMTAPSRPAFVPTRPNVASRLLAAPPWQPSVPHVD